MGVDGTEAGGDGVKQSQSVCEAVVSGAVPGA